MLDGRQVMCAKSTCFLSDEKWARAASDGVPIGALFRHFHVLPSFTLHAAGRLASGFWRQYQLRAPGLTCEINETFSDDVLHMATAEEYGSEGENDMYGAL